MNGTALKTALLRANVSQVELARRLGRSRSMVSEWVSDDLVPPEWVPIVYDVLGLPQPPQTPAESVETAIREDPQISPADREVLLVLLRTMRSRRGGD